MNEALLRDADEIFTTSTAGGIMPVSRLNGTPVADGLPGAITRTISSRAKALNAGRAHRNLRPDARGPSRAIDRQNNVAMPNMPTNCACVDEGVPFCESPTDGTASTILPAPALPSVCPLAC